jgi:chromosome segregation ATPase
MSFKTYDSLESILKLPDSMALSYGPHSSFHSVDPDKTPSPSGMQDLETALRNRDSELAFLRQTMEKNEQVIFKVHQDKERSWEQELNRLKQIHESRLRAGAQRVHKLEQLLMMQTFQLRQDKMRLQEDVNRIHTELNGLKQENEAYKSDICRYKLNEKDFKEQNSDLVEEIQMLRRVVSDLKERLEENEWNLCQRNGEISLLKTQLKDVQVKTIA